MHTLAVAEQGTHVHLEGEQLLLAKEQRVLRRVRLADLDQIVLLGRIELSSAALAGLARRGIDVVFLTQRGSFRARLVGPRSRAAALRLAQLRRAADPAFCVAVARGLVAGKVLHQRQLLLRAQRQLADPALAEALGQMRLLAVRCPAEDDLERLRGLEGRAAALYFAHLGRLVKAPAFTFATRSRRPPRDPVNACLSFGYTLLGTVVETEVQRVGLDPALGFFHQPYPGRPSLALDLLEEFRPFVDALVLRLVNRRQLGPLDFEQPDAPTLAEVLAEEDAPAEPPAGPPGSPEEAPDDDPRPAVYLAETGRRVFLLEFYRRLRERLTYPPRGASLELRDVIREQAYHLARVVDGRDDVYRPFVPS